MTLHKALHRKKNDIASIENCVDASIKGQKDTLKKNKEKLIKAVSNKIRKIRPERKNKNEEIEMGRKSNVGRFQATNKRNCSRENLEMAKEEKP